MALVTEDWSARTFTPGKSARQRFKVSDTTDLKTAIDEVFLQKNIKQGSAFVLDATLKAQSPISSTPDGPSAFVVEYEFAGPAGGGGSTFLDNPPEYGPDFSEVEYPVDMDYLANPILNSAREAFGQQPAIKDNDITYTYRRYEASFDGPRALAFRRSVNNDTFLLPGFGNVAPGQARLRYIKLGSLTTAAAQSVQVIYSFALREEGWDVRILDQGPRAGYRDSLGNVLKSEIYDKSGNAISKDVLLDGAGLPLDDSFSFATGTTGAIQPFTGPPPGATLQTITQSGSIRAVYLKYKVYEPMPYSGLTLTP